MHNRMSVGIAGSGVMAQGIALTASTAGHQVTIFSRSDSGGARAAETTNSALELIKDGPRTEYRAGGYCIPTTELEDLADCDFVIECVVEQIEPKLALFRNLDRLCSAKTILASNTSTLEISQLAAATKRADRVCGLHFFNPAPKMRLVELVAPDAASAETIDAARKFAEDCGKTVIEVKDTAGFVVNALLFPYLNRAAKMVRMETAAPEDIDKAMTFGCNHPLGPLQLLDLIGLDTAIAILDTLHRRFDDDEYLADQLLRDLVKVGRFGRKTGAGIYEYLPQHPTSIEG